MEAIVLDGDGNVIEFRVWNKERTEYLLDVKSLKQMTL